MGGIDAISILGIETSYKKYGQLLPNLDFYSTFLASSSDLASPLEPR
jgi:hypothetical protein